jgi:hypothetical protein
LLGVSIINFNHNIHLVTMVEPIPNAG